MWLRYCAYLILGWLERNQFISISAINVRSVFVPSLSFIKFKLEFRFIFDRTNFVPFDALHPERNELRLLSLAFCHRTDKEHKARAFPLCNFFNMIDCLSSIIKSGAIEIRFGSKDFQDEWKMVDNSKLTKFRLFAADFLNRVYRKTQSVAWRKLGSASSSTGT